MGIRSKIVWIGCKKIAPASLLAGTIFGQLIQAAKLADHLTESDLLYVPI